MSRMGFQLTRPWVGRSPVLVMSPMSLGALGVRGVSHIYPLSPKGGKVAHSRCYMVIAALLTLALVPTAATAATGGTAAGDPRVCAAVTPGGSARHAYWCAKSAATDALRAKMAARTHVARWFYPTSCDEAGTLLRWKCTTSGGGNLWHATVTFAHASSGWQRIVTVNP